MKPEFKEFLENQDYYSVKELPDGRICALLRMVFTEALVVDCDNLGYDYRYCFEPDGRAQVELDKFDGTTEPTGWIVKKTRQGNVHP